MIKKTLQNETFLGWFSNYEFLSAQSVGKQALPYETRNLSKMGLWQADSIAYHE